METNQYITDFYNHYDEDARLSLRHGSVEFFTTMRYIQTFAYWKSEQEPVVIPTPLRARATPLTQ